MEENFTLWSFINFTNYQMLQGDEIQRNEMRWECGTFEDRAQLHMRYWRGNLKERVHFENQSVNGEGSIIMFVQEMFSCGKH